MVAHVDKHTVLGILYATADGDMEEEKDKHARPQLPANTMGCTGCGLCESVCARHAIRMEYSVEGFMRPVVDVSRCTGCGACEKMCARVESCGRPHNDAKCVEATSSMAGERRQSASGGVCSALARCIVERGGVVFGVAHSQLSFPAYTRCETIEELAQIRGSAYMQADPARCYERVRKELSMGKMVMLVGLPCQIRAARALFGWGKQNLLLVDLACFGVPSRNLWLSYKRDLEQNGKSVVSVNFRDKRQGWRQYCITTRFHDGAEISGEGNMLNPFSRMFNTRYCLNETCYKCVHNMEARWGDITAGDYWGHKDLPGDGSADGIGSCIINTPQGERVWEMAQGHLSSKPISKEDAAAWNPGMHKGTEKIPTERKKVLQQLADMPLSSVSRRYLYPTGHKKPACSILGCRISLPEFIFNWCYHAYKQLKRH